MSYNRMILNVFPFQCEEFSVIQYIKVLSCSHLFPLEEQVLKTLFPFNQTVLGQVDLDNSSL